VEPATTGAVGRQLQSALTKEVELVKHGELVAELVKLHQHQRDRRRESHRAVFQSSASVWVTAWPTPTCRMSNSQLAACAVWYMGVQVGLPPTSKPKILHYVASVAKHLARNFTNPQKRTSPFELGAGLPCKDSLVGRAPPENRPGSSAGKPLAPARLGAGPGQTGFVAVLTPGCSLH
jgi:hypothetical protein